MSIFGVTLLPNLLAAAFNTAYNQGEIIDKWPVDEGLFKLVILAVNGFFFPFGLFVLGWMIWPVRTALRRLRSGDPVDAAELARRRVRALGLGRITAAACVGCWLGAGVVWPTVLWLREGPPQPGTGLVLHFMASFVVCGLIAATYPYFLVTYRTVRVLYPALLGRDGPGSADGPALRRVERELGVYRVLAAAIPLAAVGLIVSFGVTKDKDTRLAVAILSVTGVAGSVMVYLLEGRIRADLQALAEMPRT